MPQPRRFEAVLAGALGGAVAFGLSYAVVVREMLAQRDRGPAPHASGHRVGG